MTHRYAQRSADFLVKTPYGKFHLCAACVRDGHCGTQRPPTHGSANPYERLPLPEPGQSVSCDCEHVSHQSVSCGHCGSSHLPDRSCDCFDNGCE